MESFVSYCRSVWGKLCARALYTFYGADWEREFRDYVFRVRAEWPSSRRTQAIKLLEAIDKVAESESISREDVVDHIIKIARHRLNDRPMTVFLASCGSSGSHWLEGMMSQFSGYEACGEVYLPRSRLNSMRYWRRADSAAFLDCVHLLHARAPLGDLSRARLINSAHKSIWALSDLMSGPKFNILLVRNPIDIVMSRTYRKSYYREFIAPESGDREYLDRNIEFVNGFFLLASKHKRDFIVSYEGLKASGANVLDELFAALDTQQDKSEIIEVVRRYSKEEQLSSGGKVLSNVYRGEGVNISDQVKEYVVSRLSLDSKKFM